jgi:hypothetical protein
MEWRRAAHDVRAGRPAPPIPRPGLARARADVAPQQASKRTG